ncbi:MAG: M15 family metallopeptidase [Burkholderiaceae bacterium]|nr:M15 family metallopeptidase [Burkholderiaceae bacterium]
MATLTRRDYERLRGVHPDLVTVIESARALMLPPLGFIVTEGRRSAERQRQLFDAGASRTMRSRHLTGHAVDLAVTIAGTVRWDWPLYESLGKIVKRAAKENGLRIIWGGDWKTFRDGPHFELPRSRYPDV